MTTPAKPTARPWFSAEYASPRGTAYIRGPNNERIIGGGLSPSVEDTALIVKAVNGWDGLLEALRSIVSATHYERGLLARQINGIAFAALAKATGDE